MKSKRTNNQWVFMAPSGIEGKGLFARRTIPAGTLMVEYAGPRVSADEGARLAAEGNAFIFRVNRRESIDGSVNWNLGRHANHSCQPNARSTQVGAEMWLKALRAIEKGEEITYDYGYSFREEPVACLCRAPGCPGFIVATRHR